MSLKVTALRATTEKNFGRPAPTVPVRNPASLNPVAQRQAPQNGVAGTGSKKTQRRRAQAKRARARNRGEYDPADAERAAEHFAQLEAQYD